VQNPTERIRFRLAAVDNEGSLIQLKRSK